MGIIMYPKRVVSRDVDTGTACDSISLEGRRNCESGGFVGPDCAKGVETEVCSIIATNSSRVDANVVPCNPFGCGYAAATRPAVDERTTLRALRIAMVIKGRPYWVM
jgi:hypothetical protein